MGPGHLSRQSGIRKRLQLGEQMTPQGTYAVTTELIRTVPCASARARWNRCSASRLPRAAWPCGWPQARPCLPSLRIQDGQRARFGPTSSASTASWPSRGGRSWFAWYCRCPNSPNAGIVAEYLPATRSAYFFCPMICCQLTDVPRVTCFLSPVRGRLHIRDFVLSVWVECVWHGPRGPLTASIAAVAAGLGDRQIRLASDAFWCNTARYESIPNRGEMRCDTRRQGREPGLAALTGPGA